MIMLLYCDKRSGETEWFYDCAPADFNMRVPDEVLKSVCFLCAKDRRGGVEKVIYGGTASFISYPLPTITEFTASYLVTAKHVVETAKIEYGDLYARVNRTDGGSGLVKLPHNWFYSDNPAVDVAVLPFGLTDEWEYKMARVRMAITDEAIEQFGIGVGDEVLMTGLFSERKGAQRNLPIVRAGVIASMADEPLIDPGSGEEYLAYLCEVRSIGGLSGSPAFVHLPLSRGVDAFNARGLDTFLLGVVRGHWEYDGLGAGGGFGEKEKINTGIAVVSRMQDVVEVLECEELVKHRKQIDEEHQNPPVGDSAIKPSFTRKDFEGSLKKVRRRRSKPSPPEQASSET